MFSEKINKSALLIIKNSKNHVIQMVAYSGNWKWLEWNFVLGYRADGSRQIDFILDFIKPLIEDLDQKKLIDEFYFCRHFVPVRDKKIAWDRNQDYKKIEYVLSQWENVSYVILGLRAYTQHIESVKSKIYDKSGNFEEIYPIFVREFDVDAKDGLEVYGGDAVCGIQHEYFHYMSKISLKLLRLDRSKRLKDNEGNTCGIEDIAAQWCHFFLNQLGILEEVKNVDLNDGTKGPAWFYKKFEHIALKNKGN